MFSTEPKRKMPNGFNLKKYLYATVEQLQQQRLLYTSAFLKLFSFGAPFNLTGIQATPHLDSTWALGGREKNSVILPHVG